MTQSDQKTRIACHNCFHRWITRAIKQEVGRWEGKVTCPSCNRKTTGVCEDCGSTKNLYLKPADWGIFARDSFDTIILCEECSTNIKVEQEIGD